MSNEILNKEDVISAESADVTPLDKAESPVNTEDVSAQSKSGGVFGNIRFFGCCSKSLKRFSIILFIINIFVSIGLTGALVVVLFFKVGLDMLSFLAFPIVTVFIVLIIIARFISALVYGFAEIVEKNEK